MPSGSLYPYIVLQHRGGRGRSATDVKQEDVVEKVLITNSHDMLLCFSNFGRAYWIKTYVFPKLAQVRGSH